MASSLGKLEKLLKPRILSLVYEQEFGFTNNGKSTSLGGEYDRKLLITLRQRSDLIVTTGKTAEVEKYIQPKKPLILITSRQDAADWLRAERLQLDDPKLLERLRDKLVLYETGLQMSKKLFARGLIDQIVLHHDKKDLPVSELSSIDFEKSTQIAFHGRYISLLERRGS